MKTKATPRGKKVALEIPEELWWAVKRQALDDHTNFRTVVIDAIGTHLRRRKKKTEKEGGKHAR